MVTGAYHPETSGASLQCRQLIAHLSGRVDFVVLTTTTNRSLPVREAVDGVDVWRLPVDPQSAMSKARAMLDLTRAMSALRSSIDIVHLHGFSQKTMAVVALACLFGKPIVIKLTSAGHDDAESMRARGAVAFAFYRRADRFIGVGPRFLDAHRAAGLDESRFRLVPNGVDLARFRPATAPEQAALRVALGLPIDARIVLFVGFFSPEKRPDALYRAWAPLAEADPSLILVLIGPTASAYYEIDHDMAGRIRMDARRRGLEPRVVFVERTASVEDYYRAADVFALPTLREGMPNVLLEAMASGVPPIITRLPGVTDWIVEPGTGTLVMPDDERELRHALAAYLTDETMRQTTGHAARASMAARFPAAQTADLTAAIYDELIG